MLACFHENLAHLRKLKKVNQREAAAELGVSQALLSHYEKGLREPGMEFLVNAANYYGVSADWLLGRTSDMTGAAMDLSAEQEGMISKDDGVRRTARVRRDKAAAQETVGILFDVLGRMDAEQAEDACRRHLESELYRLFSYLHLICGHGTGCRDLFVLPRRYVDTVAAADQEAASRDLLRLASAVERGRKNETFVMTPDGLEQEFGERGVRLVKNLHDTSARLQIWLEGNTGKER